jgi:hypothetical protein
LRKNTFRKGTASAVPQFVVYQTALATEVRFFPSALADASRKNVPQWLKPGVFQSFCGTAEAVPFRE